MTIQPIETAYKGYRFRSRLEARWAVFFDAVPLKWEYEPEGFELGKGLRYLPDFWLPEVNLWVEVKPDGGFSERALNKIDRLVYGSGHSCLLLEGTPESKAYLEYSPLCHKWVWLSTEYLHEHRFYVSCCGVWSCCGYPNWELDLAVKAARSARFDERITVSMSDDLSWVPRTT